MLLAASLAPQALASASALPTPPRTPPAAAAAHPLTPAQALAKYAAALAALKMPRAYTFEYAIEHRGGRSLERTHRVYRAGNNERDEITSVDGQRLTRPQIRIFRGRRDRYAIPFIAPRAGAYAFAFAGMQKSGKRSDYIFNATPVKARAFSVSQIVLDGTSFLPSKVVFTTHAGAVRGEGLIAYAKHDRFWMPVAAVAKADVSGKHEIERLVFARYRFFPSLPAATFSQPRPLPGASAAPSPLPTASVPPVP